MLSVTKEVHIRGVCIWKLDTNLDEILSAYQIQKNEMQEAWACMGEKRFGGEI